MKNILATHVLVLSKSWHAVDTCTLQSAFGKLCTETCRFLDHRDFTLHNVDSWFSMVPEQGELVVRTSKTEIRVPEVIVLNANAPLKKRIMQFSRRNLMRRDKGVCQFCGIKPDPSDTTVDHLVPRRKNGKSTWMNCVISCKSCNTRKADRTLQEAKMKLRDRPEMREAYPHDPTKWSRPFEPAWSPIFRINTTEIKDSWRQFLSEEIWRSGKAGYIIIRK